MIVTKFNYVYLCYICENNVLSDNHLYVDILSNYHHIDEKSN
jgi:hypothetical protein